MHSKNVKHRCMKCHRKLDSDDQQFCHNCGAQIEINLVHEKMGTPNMAKIDDGQKIQEKASHTSVSNDRCHRCGKKTGFIHFCSLKK